MASANSIGPKNRPTKRQPTGGDEKEEQQNSRTEMMRIMEKVWRGIIRTR
jgi:hypothetical protein